MLKPSEWCEKRFIETGDPDYLELCNIKPSEWCHKIWTECIERGDEESAGHYMELYNQWLSRGY